MGTVIGMLIALAVAIWVVQDAQKHGMKLSGLWGVGVFLLLIVVLPAYFIARKVHDNHSTGAAHPA